MSLDRTAEAGAADPGVVKACIAWIGVLFGKAGIHTWSDLAAVLAAIYTSILISDWLYKKWKRRKA
jgi:hypothetical protein